MILWGDDMPVYFGHDRIDGVSVTFPGCSGSLTDTSDATLNSSAQLLKDVTAYSKGEKYIGDIPTRGAGDLVVSGASVSFPAGYYETSHNVSVDTTSLSAPSIEVTAGGLITATVDQMVSGYIEAGSASKTMQLPTQGAKNITPSMSQQIAVGSGKYATGDIVVDAMPTGTLATPIINKSTGLVTASISRAGYINSSTQKTLQLSVKGAATITPGSSAQTISAGQFLTGVQTIQGDTNLVPENIIYGKSIFGVPGNVVIQKYYTGTSEPSSSLGNDGDIYLKE